MQGQKPEAGRQKSEAGSKKSEISGLQYLLILVYVCHLSSVICPPSALSSEKWQGVDQSVVEKYAKEQGREAQKPLINTGQGDLLLFVFLIAGAAGGFAAGYYWRMLVHDKKPATAPENDITG